MIRKNETGSASVEATLSLTAFMFLIMSIYMIVNFCIMQAKIGYAINTTAKEMSQYTYFYHALGLEKIESTLKDKKTQAVDTFGNFNKLIDNSEAVVTDVAGDPSNYLEQYLTGEKTEDLNTVYAQIQQANADITNVVNDPAEFLKSMAAIAGEDIWNKVKTNIIAAPLAKGMTRRHFGSNAAEADAYLIQHGLEGGYDSLNYNLSTLFEDEDHENISIVVCYNLNVAALFPFDLNITICQRAETRAWLGGDLDLE